MIGASHDKERVWKHIYGEQQGYLALFSGVRPPSGYSRTRTASTVKLFAQGTFGGPRKRNRLLDWWMRNLVVVERLITAPTL